METQDAMARIRNWLTDLPIRDNAERQSALVLQAVLIPFAVLLLAAIVSNLAAEKFENMLGNSIASILIFLIVFALRKGYFKTAILSFVGVLMALILQNMLNEGLTGGLSAMQLTVPVALAAALLPRRWVTMLVIVSLAAIAYSASQPVPMAQPTSLFGTIMNYGSVIFLLAIFLTSIGRTYRSALLKEQDALQLARNANLELEKRNAELEQFIYAVSHDLKTPLVTIRGFLGYLEQDITAGKQERISTDMARIVEASDKMQILLKELLELSRVGRVAHPPEKVRFDLIVQEAARELHDQFMEKGVQLVVQPALPVVHVDRARLVEVVQNLLENAIKFTDGQVQPQIEVGACEGKEGTIFYVKDNGIGVAPEFHHRIFGLFDKLSPYTDGAGIGLTLAKRIVEVHGGEIWVESKGEGGGATFCFTLGSGD